MTATDSDAPRLAVEYRPLDSLEPNPRNPKDHDVGGIMQSLRRFGFADVPVVDDRTGRLVAGHGRVDAVAALREAVESGDGDWQVPKWIVVDPDGVWHIPVQTGWSSVDDQEADAALIALNAWTERGGWDAEGLTRMLSELAEHPRGLEGVGYDDQDLERMVEDLGEPLNLDGVVEPEITHHGGNPIVCPACGHEFHIGAH